MSTIDVSFDATGIWAGQAQLNGDVIDVRSTIQENDSHALSGVLYFGDPSSGGLLDFGSVTGKRTDASGNWATAAGAKVAGTFATDTFSGTLTIPRAGTAGVQAALELHRTPRLLQGFVPIVPGRLLDTRTDHSDPPYAGSVQYVAVTGLFEIPDNDVGAVVVNITGTDTLGPGYVTAWASGTDQPATSNLNLERAGQTAANLAIVPVGSDGHIRLFTQSGGHLIVDAFGWFSTSSILHLTAVPTRVLDTRSTSALGYSGATPGPGAIVDVSLAVPGGLPPSGVGAAVVNITATGTLGPGYVTAWPTGQLQPPTSNLNISAAGQTICNLAIVPVGADSKLSLFSQSGTDLIVDVFGWFAVSTASAGPLQGVRSDGNLVSDGSFEASASIAKQSSFNTITSSLGSWMVTSGAVDIVGPGSAKAFDGDQFIDLNGNGYSPGTLEQLIPTSADRRYQVSFQLAGNPNGTPAVKTLEVTFGAGKQQFSFDVGGHTNADLGWTEHSFIANPDCGASTVLSLRSTTKGDKGPNIDAVKVVDVGPGTGCHLGGYQSIGPLRVFDTRPATQVGYTGDKPNAGAILRVQIAGVSGVAATGITAVAINLTATEAGGPGYVTAWASGTLQPDTSNLNLESVGQTRPNYAIVPVGIDGGISLFTQTDNHLIVDVFGWFA